MIWEMAFGIMCVVMIFQLDWPITLAAPTYWESLREITTPRTIRARGDRENGNGDDGVSGTGTEDGYDNHGKQQTRESQEYVNNSGNGGVYPSSEVTCGYTQENTYSTTGENACETDEKGDSGTVYDSCQNVSSQVVSTKDMS